MFSVSLGSSQSSFLEIEPSTVKPCEVDKHFQKTLLTIKSRNFSSLITF